MMYCMQFAMFVYVVSMMSWYGVSWGYVYVGYDDVLEVFCVYFQELYFCVVCVDGLWRLDVCECCVWFNVGGKSASLFVFSVCADGSEVWYLWCPGCGGELWFLYCDYVRLCCAHEMLEFLHGTPYAVYVELKNLYLFVFCFGGILFVSCVTVCGWGGVVGDVDVLGLVLLGASYGSLCDGNMWGESGRVGCIRSSV